jgi:eukaryotic-like serine/threonine-protein kinase
MFLSDVVMERLRESTGRPDLSGTRYQLLEELGRGGMGVVYAAQDEALGREVALKVSSFAGATADLFAAALQREARVLAQLEHPGIVPVHDAGVLPDGRVYYAMKRVRGQRLDAWARGQTELRPVLRMFQRVCEAVAFAHAHQVIHRDLKPQNVMVGEFGEALVMDWGASAAAGEAGSTAGTLGFMAPEQARGEGAADARSDVYGLGATLRALLDSRSEPAPPPLVSICAKATTADLRQRYAGAAELLDEVGRFLDGAPVLAHPETLLQRTARFTRRNRVALALLAAYLAVRALLFLWPR